MGLDQYLSRKVVQKDEIYYWRKFGELQNLMEQIWREQTHPKDSDEFNCVELKLTPEICDRVIKAIRQKKLPTHEGYFYGSDNMGDKEYLDEAIRRFQQVKEDLMDNPDQEIVYHAWY